MANIVIEKDCNDIWVRGMESVMSFRITDTDAVDVNILPSVYLKNGYIKYAYVASGTLYLVEFDNRYAFGFQFDDSSKNPNGPDSYWSSNQEAVRDAFGIELVEIILRDEFSICSYILKSEAEKLLPEEYVFIDMNLVEGSYDRGWHIIKKEDLHLFDNYMKKTC